MFVVHRALATRHQYKDVFDRGSYLPLMAQGQYEDNVVAFARQWAGKTVVAIAPRFFTRIIEPCDYPIGKVWSDTLLTLPPSAAGWRDCLSNQTQTYRGEVPLSKLLSTFPVALLVSEAPPAPADPSSENALTHSPRPHTLTQTPYIEEFL